MRTLLNMTWNEARDRFYNGTISQREWERFCFAHEWSAARFSSHAQARYHARHGGNALYRRIDRVRGALGLAPYNYKPETSRAEGER